MGHCAGGAVAKTGGRWRRNHAERAKRAKADGRSSTSQGSKPASDKAIIAKNGAAPRVGDPFASVVLLGAPRVAGIGRISGPARGAAYRSAFFAIRDCADGGISGPARDETCRSALFAIPGAPYGEITGPVRPRTCRSALCANPGVSYGGISRPARFRSCRSAFFAGLPHGAVGTSRHRTPSRPSLAILRTPSRHAVASPAPRQRCERSRQRPWRRSRLRPSLRTRD